MHDNIEQSPVEWLVYKEKDPAEWEKEFNALVVNVANATAADSSETEEEKQARIKRLEAPGNQEEWIKYYFPKYSFAAPAAFQKNATLRLINACKEMQAKGWGKYSMSRKWGRGLAKSTRRMMEVFYLHFVLKLPINGLFCSKSESNAIDLMAPYMANLEGNQKLIKDYGVQKNLGNWDMKKFISKSGMGYKAVGTTQNPRGSKNEEMRINVIQCDDADDDAVCRNADLLNQAWRWYEKQVLPCVEISRPYFIFFDNNVIAEDSLAVRFSKTAKDNETINIRDENEKSTWPEKNTEEIIEEMLDGMSYESIQGEYYNNPMAQEITFPDITWGECPALEDLDDATCYSDPAPSNKELPTAKSGGGNSNKATFIIGRKGARFYIYYGFLGGMNTAKFVDGLFSCRDYVGNRRTIDFYIENNSLQDPFFEQVLQEKIYEAGETKGYLYPSQDTRKKPDKWVRIESTLEPINRKGNLIFNIAEKGNANMIRLEAQFRGAKPTSKKLDGPDCIEGGVHVLKVRNVAHAAEVLFQERFQSDAYHY
ncbi:hypothetical protein CJD36_019915 [Flavipsychrobacter stenotrophus]|uniref:Terminase n=1 Tax=Flavipsychrobacter stenotrophus TaxID=2077091 RepID=A0A2S7SS13_9BACT|nr:hypothetical protein [Flavipsychrobacter stenotrophus]PQJ09508.1 hypothetical protein CJD36_019915 [Flavipsychrobacter stenotrophus]